MGEFHYAAGNHNHYPMNVTADGKHVLKDRNEGRKVATDMLHLIDVTDGCMTRSVRVEDGGKLLFQV
eukprot:scaffold11421_cov77-Skeletonema_dohrnii-CCMP3373.AAC.1